MSDQLAHEVTLVVGEGVYIDGTRFPYHVSADFDVDAGPNVIPTVTLGLFAQNITIIDDKGVTTHPATASARDETEWARRRAQEIVRDGLADVIAWIGEGSR